MVSVLEHVKPFSIAQALWLYDHHSQHNGRDAAALPLPPVECFKWRGKAKCFNMEASPVCPVTRHARGGPKARAVAAAHTPKVSCPRLRKV